MTVKNGYYVLFSVTIGSETKTLRADMNLDCSITNIDVIEEIERQFREDYPCDDAFVLSWQRYEDA